jgi:hypothetical protein
LDGKTGQSGSSFNFAPLKMPKKKSPQPNPQGVQRMYNKFDQLAKELSDDEDHIPSCPPGFPPGFDFGK